MLFDNRHEAIAQRKLIDAVDNSPRMLAQRKKLRNMFGEVAQGTGGSDEGRSVEPLLDPNGGATGSTPTIPSTGTVQFKGDRALMSRLEPLTGWAMVHVENPLDPQDPFKSLFKKINDYDRSKDGRPAQQFQMLVAMIADLFSLPLALSPQLNGDDNTQFMLLTETLIQERNDVEQQAKRLDRFTRDPNAPYEQMTTEGMLWSHPSYEHSTGHIGQTGKAYFSALSAGNRDSMQGEAQQDNLLNEVWFNGFVGRATVALSGSVVNHYTTAKRAQEMVDGGGMKSKMMLEKTNAEFKHNTSAYDDLGLGNSGFLFFFIESPNAPQRPTRFAEGDGDNVRPARISIPIQESGLLENGWIMLSDFAQREYPDIVTTTSNDEHKSWLPTRATDEKKKDANKPFTQSVKHFEQGVSAMTADDMKSMMDEPSSERRQAMSAVTPQARGDPLSKQMYSGPQGTLEVPDRMMQNVLVGADIIVGLATRAALEVARITSVNTGLGERLQALEGDALMLFMLKDLFRPQAMIPNSFVVLPAHVQLG